MSEEPLPPLLPHSLESERATLGAALLHDTAADYLAHRLTPATYFRRAHQTIFRAILELRDQNVRVDLLTIKQHLGAKATEEIGGPSYLSVLTDGIPAGLNIASYADILDDLATKRALVRFGMQLLERAAGGERSAKDLLLDIDRTVLELQHGHALGRLTSLQASARALSEDLEYRIAHKGQLSGLETGFGSINNLTMGWQLGDLIIVAARPSIGKTTFAVNTAVAAARAGARVAFFSMEMRRQQLEYRILASVSGVHLTRLLGGYVLGDEEWKRLSGALAEMHTLPIAIDDSPRLSAWDMRSACRQMKSGDGVDLVVADYVQLMSGTLERKGSTRNEEVTDISRRLKMLAGEANVALLLLSQLNRGADGRTDPRPRLSDLRESGSLEQDADLVCFLHRKHHREGGVTNFIIEKQRNGPTGTINLSLDRDLTLFTDAGDAPPEAVAAPETPEEKAERQRKLFARRARAR